ncbi:MULTISPECIES: hypothetical protein [unclassified Streptomyces]|uniref:hypothetical protein n=1 Tax=unclassified Streptomyces TaxID=2593676 RepID=UPI0005A7DC52|nr:MULTISPECIES: hypothetical protein [unclassified Streptomyces]ODA75272.1 hypothetical protein APS67_000433 [Streptomyces sp. AVP053U2]
MRTGRCGVRIEGLAEADGFPLAQDTGDGLTALLPREDLSDEGGDRVGDTFRRARPGLRLVHERDISRT